MPRFTFESHSLHYREQGDGPLLVILPGNTASSAAHEGELAHFSRWYRTVSLDFLGTGQSDRLDKWDTTWWRNGARQAKALVDHLDATDCVVMGTSGGAIAALLMAAHFPAAVTAVVADSCGERYAPERLRAEVALREQAPEGLVSFWKAAHGGDWAQVVGADSSLLLQMADEGGDCFGRSLGLIRCPVLLTASLGDSFLTDAQPQLRSMARQIRNSRTYLHDSGDHPLMWTEADAFRRQVHAFLENPA